MLKMERQYGGHPYEYIDTPWNLFDPLTME